MGIPTDDVQILSPYVVPNQLFTNNKRLRVVDIY